MADPKTPDENSLQTKAGAFDKLPDNLGPSLPLDAKTAPRPVDRSIEGASTHVQEGVTVSSTLDDSPAERRDPFDRPETEAGRTLKAAGAQLMPGNR